MRSAVKAWVWRACLLTLTVPTVPIGRRTLEGAALIWACSVARRGGLRDCLLGLGGVVAVLINEGRRAAALGTI